jgi:hypothetical protein
MLEWKRDDASYLERIEHLEGTASGGLNGTTFLTASTVEQDTADDTLTGNAGEDWFWANVLQDVLDEQPGEQVN